MINSTGTTNPHGAEYSSDGFLRIARRLHGDHFFWYRNLAERIAPSTWIEPVCRLHGAFQVTAQEHLRRFESGGCPKCQSKESLSAYEVDRLCRDTLPNAHGDPWSEVVFAPLPIMPAFAVGSGGGLVYDRIRRWKRGRREPVFFEDSWDTQLTTELMDVEYWLGWMVITTHRPIFFQEGYWIRRRDGNPYNCDLPNLYWKEKRDYWRRFCNEMYEPDVEWDLPSDSDDSDSA